MLCKLNNVCICSYNFSLLITVYFPFFLLFFYLWRFWKQAFWFRIWWPNPVTKFSGPHSILSLKKKKQEKATIKGEKEIVFYLSSFFFEMLIIFCTAMYQPIESHFKGRQEKDMLEQKKEMIFFSLLNSNTLPLWRHLLWKLPDFYEDRINLEFLIESRRCVNEHVFLFLWKRVGLIFDLLLFHVFFADVSNNF